MGLRFVVASLLIFSAFSSTAEDVVRVKYFSGYPPPDLSSEAIEIEVSRIAPYRRSRDLDVDRYFAGISKILADESVSSNWERSVVHGRFVRVEIAAEGKKITLGSSYSANGLDSFPDQDGLNERHRRALEGILKVTLQRVQQGAPVK